MESVEICVLSCHLFLRWEIVPGVEHYFLVHLLTNNFTLLPVYNFFTAPASGSGSAATVTRTMSSSLSVRGEATGKLPGMIQM